MMIVPNQNRYLSTVILSAAKEELLWFSCLMLNNGRNSLVIARRREQRLRVTRTCWRGRLLPANELVRGQDRRAQSLVAMTDLESIHLPFDLSLTTGKQQCIFHGFPIQTQAQRDLPEKSMLYEAR